MRIKRTEMDRRIGDIDPDVVRQYEQYWDEITPWSLEGRWKRWVFALLSGQTGWQANVDSYNAVMSTSWDSKDELMEILKDTRAGLYNAKAEGIWRLTSLYRTAGLGERVLAHPDEIAWEPGWRNWRDHLGKLTNAFRERAIPYAGQKIISFAHEMCWPRTCGVVAVDTHVAQWYGVKIDKMTPALYNKIESHWLQACNRYGYPSPLVRHILWDQEQGFEDTRYWANVFEEARVAA